MAKLVLDVQLRNHLKESDLIVYDEKKECWQVIPKALFLNGIKKEFKELKKQVEDLQAKYDEVLNNVQTMARIMREGLE